MLKLNTSILWPPDANNWLIRKVPDAGKDWRQEEMGMAGWDGWMASLTQWTWVWVGSGSWWWTGRLGVLWSMGLQRVGHDWATELNWTESDLTHRVIHKNQHESIHFSSKNTGLERMLWINMLIYCIVKLLSAKTVSVIILVLVVVSTWPCTKLSGNKWILNQVDALC